MKELTTEVPIVEKSMDKLLCDRDLRHEQVQAVLTQLIMLLI